MNRWGIVSSFRWYRAERVGRHGRGRRSPRAASDIIAVILLVAITVVLAAILYVLITGLTHGPGSTPIGSAFEAAHAISSNSLGTGGGADSCAAATTTSVASAIVPGHWTYTMTVESSTVTFGSILLQVKTSAGMVADPAGAGGFFVVNSNSNVVACDLPVPVNGGLSMGGPAQFTFIAASGISSVSPLTNLYTIVIDMGTTSPVGSGFTFDAIWQGSFSGTTSPLSLP
jgi:flagellin-like protein